MFNEADRADKQMCGNGKNIYNLYKFNFLWDSSLTKLIKNPSLSIVSFSRVLSELQPKSKGLSSAFQIKVEVGIKSP